MLEHIAAVGGLIGLIGTTGYKVMTSFDVYLKNEKEKDIFHFPVNPIDCITINREKKFSTVDIIDKGEFDISDKGKKIKTISFDTLLPKEYDTYCRYVDIPKPIEAIAKLEKWMNQREPLRLIITGFDFNDLVIISNIDEKELPGETGDKYITINFRTYRELKIETLNSTSLKSKSSSVKKIQLKNNRPNTKSVPKTYIVKSGDSLWKIAKRYYGDGTKWNRIYNKNKNVVGSDANKIYPGQKLVI